MCWWVWARYRREESKGPHEFRHKWEGRSWGAQALSWRCTCRASPGTPYFDCLFICDGLDRPRRKSMAAKCCPCQLGIAAKSTPRASPFLWMSNETSASSDALKACSSVEKNSPPLLLLFAALILLVYAYPVRHCKLSNEHFQGVCTLVESRKMTLNWKTRQWEMIINAMLILKQSKTELKSTKREQTHRHHPGRTTVNTWWVSLTHMPVLAHIPPPT